MGDILRRLLLLFVTMSISSYAIFVVIGIVVSEKATDLTRIVMVRDALAPGVHYLSGMVMVPRSCAQLSVKEGLISTSTRSLQFRTWDVPSVPCEKGDVPRAFRIVVFAPAAGVEFTGTLDDAPLTLVVHQAPYRAKTTDSTLE